MSLHQNLSYVVKCFFLMLALHSPLITYAYTDELSANEAKQIALELSGGTQLLPPEPLYQQIYSELAAIRQHYPGLLYIPYYPKWEPGLLVIMLTPEATEQFNRGEYHGFDNLNAQYGPVSVERVFDSSFLHLNFNRYYSPEYLAPLYEQTEGILSANVRYLGAAGDYSTAMEAAPPEYRFVQSTGYGAEMHSWTFQVTDGMVNLIQEGGASLVDIRAYSYKEGYPVDGSLKVGEQLRLKFDLYHSITEPFDFYLFAEILGETYTLYFDGSIAPGITPLYQNIPSLFPNPEILHIGVFGLDFSPANIILPPELSGETITFYVVVVQADLIPPVSSLAELNTNTPHVIMFDKNVQEIH